MTFPVLRNAFIDLLKKITISQAICLSYAFYSFVNLSLYIF